MLKQASLRQIGERDLLIYIGIGIAVVTAIVVGFVAWGH